MSTSQSTTYRSLHEYMNLYSYMNADINIIIRSTSIVEQVINNYNVVLYTCSINKRNISFSKFRTISIMPKFWNTNQF